MKFNKIIFLTTGLRLWGYSTVVKHPWVSSPVPKQKKNFNLNSTKNMLLGFAYTDLLLYTIKFYILTKQIKDISYRNTCIPQLKSHYQRQNLSIQREHWVSKKKFINHWNKEQATPEQPSPQSYTCTLAQFVKIQNSHGHVEEPLYPYGVHYWRLWWPRNDLTLIIRGRFLGGD